MRKELLKEILSIPTYFSSEERIKEFLIKYANERKITLYQDKKGNLYMIKGILDKGEYYPCVLAHMDTVHHEQISLVTNNIKLNIYEDNNAGNPRLWASYKKYDSENLTGIGGDDKAGIFICLELLEKYDKIIAAFFVEEEFGCRGSKMVDTKILENVGYFIQFDAPTNNWFSFSCGGVQLFNEEIFNNIFPILKKYEINNISIDPYTDIFILKKTFNVACMNFFAGYYNMHRANEYVLLNDIDKAINFGSEIIMKLGNKHYNFLSTNKPDMVLYEKIKHLLN